MEDLFKTSYNDVKLQKNFDKIVLIIKDIIDDQNLKNIKSKSDFVKSLDHFGRKHKLIPSLFETLSVYRHLVQIGKFKYNTSIDNMLKTKNQKSLSGIVSITVFTSPYPETSKGIQQFSCEYDCHYCPKEPNQPRSYLLKEPGVQRANVNNFISTDQFWDRALTLIKMGHPLDKIELIVSGGTFNSYPLEYTTNFIRDQFYAANVAYDKFNGLTIRPPFNLKEEQEYNQNVSMIKIIGLTIETRPDRTKKRDLIYFRELGVTRVQIGVQHTNDIILDFINRRCKNSHTISSIKALKESGFKVDIHIMPDLPHPDSITNQEMIELDKEMFEKFINNPDYQADQWKIYPCETVPFTEIEKWYKEGTYKPYSEIKTEDGQNPLFKLLIDVKSKVKPWVRLNRIIRDIPNIYIIGGNQNTSMRCDLINTMKKKGLKCKCIRCREIKDQKININDFDIKVRTYDASDGIEHFISWENNDELLLGFLRLRFNKEIDNKYFPELSGCALIRELHIYGQLLNHNLDSNDTSLQHKGLGKKLISKAIDIAKLNNYNKIAVIAGVGVRNYYIKQGFNPCDSNNIKTNGNFLILDIESKNIDQNIWITNTKYFFRKLLNKVGIIV